MNDPVTLRPGELRIDDLRRIANSDVRVRLDPGCKPGVEAAAATVENIVRSGATCYGINTGFGRLASTVIPAADLKQLQRNLVLSHAAGTGAPLHDDTVRMVLALKIASLARGHSGVRWVVIESLLTLLEAGVLPCIPAKGSVGASGDLAPLAHLSTTLLGEGQVRHRGEVLPAAEGLARAGLQPLELQAKEGLALLNGTQVSTALGLVALFAVERLFTTAVLTGALAIDAARGSDAPFDERIHQLRGQPGQIVVAAAYRELLDGSGIRASHLQCDRVQDPYSLRCQPQVMGACLDHIRFAAAVLFREANAVSDNPLVFADPGEALSGGNFHAEPVAMACDVLAIAIAETGSLSERRLALLIDASLSTLPPFLVADSGLNSGFMIAQVTAAALASENKSLAHPASVDSLPTSANQEDHVSMAAYAARRLHDMADNATGIIAIELLATAQGIEFHRPLRSSAILEQVIAELRTRVPSYQRDRLFAPDIEAARELISSGMLADYAPAALSELLGPV